VPMEKEKIPPLGGGGVEKWTWYLFIGTGQKTKHSS